MIYTCGYCLIKGDVFFSTNIPAKMKRHNETKKHLTNRKLCLDNEFICKRCDGKFPNQQTLDKHIEYNSITLDSGRIIYNPICNDFSCSIKAENNGYSKYTQEKGGIYAPMKKLASCNQTFASFQDKLEHEANDDCGGLHPCNTTVGGQPKKSANSRKRKEIKKPKGFDERFKLNSVKVEEENNIDTII